MKEPAREKRRVPGKHSKGSLTMLGELSARPAEGPRGAWGFVRDLCRQFSRYFIAGLMVWVPFIVTLWLSWWVIRKFGFGTEDLIKQGVQNLQDLGERYDRLHFLTYLFYMPGFGFLFVIALFLSTGLVARYVLTRRIIRFGERIVERIPLINTIYRAVQQIRDVFVSREGTVFQEVCMIEYPKAGSYVVAFVTSREKGIIQAAMGRDLVALFVPTTPNPTSGFLLYVPPEAITKIPISVEDAMKLIISGGAFLPAGAELPE